LADPPPLPPLVAALFPPESELQPTEPTQARADKPQASFRRLFTQVMSFSSIAIPDNTRLDRDIRFLAFPEKRRVRRAAQSLVLRRTIHLSLRQTVRCTSATCSSSSPRLRQRRPWGVRFRNVAGVASKDRRNEIKTSNQRHPYEVKSVASSNAWRRDVLRPSSIGPFFAAQAAKSGALEPSWAGSFA